MDLSILMCIIIAMIIVIAAICVKSHELKKRYTRLLGLTKDSAEKEYRSLLDTLSDTKGKVKAAKDELSDINGKSQEYANKFHEYDVELEKAKSQLGSIKAEIKAADDRLDDVDRLYKEKQLYVKDVEDKADKIFDERCKRLDQEFAARKQQKEADMLELEEAIQKVMQELEAIKATRDVAIELKRQEEEVNANLDFYRLDISDSDKQDIDLLNQIRPRFSNPRVIAKLIWSEYYQKLAKVKFPAIIGNSISGIYKITNIKNGKCYVGQAVDLKKRFQDHCKCGCGLDTPANNKLYRAMLDDGLYNFTFEVVEACDKELLNQKESYFIDMLSAVDYGYNSRKEGR